jgi:hypothetical protein
MAAQTIEIHGEKYVILPEQEYLALQLSITQVSPAATPAPENGSARFRNVVPLHVGGTPPSELLMRDRR